MTPSFFILLVAGASLRTAIAAAGVPDIRPVLLADTNRDGFVNDLDDTPDKHLWTAQSGAIFLPNIGDINHRCAIADLSGNPLSNAELATCNDASGDVLLSPHLAARIRVAPLEGLSNNVTGRIYTEPAATLGRVRIFWNNGDSDEDSSQWVLLDPQFEFNATSLGHGLSLAIDSRELVSDSSTWDGAVNVFFDLVDGDRRGSDFVAMKQAPVLVHHHLQRPEVVISVETMDSVSRSQPEFLRSLKKTLGELGSNLPLVLLNQSNEVWGQDWAEPGFASMPGPNGTISLRVLVRSAQSTRTNGRRVFEQFRGPDVGGFQPGLGSGFGYEEINSGGNIETIPPYVSKSGVRYLNGRVVMAKHFDKYPAESMVKFLESQAAQSPLFLEAGWLVVGHTDEMVQFLPFDNDLGFTIGIADTTAALDILKKARDDGHGLAHVVSFNGSMEWDTDSIFLDPDVRNITIQEILSDKRFLDVNQYAQRYLDNNLALLLREIPLAEKDVLRIPALWSDVTYPWPRNPDGRPARVHQTLPGERQLMAFSPSIVNGLVLGSDYIAAKPWGPIINGKDIVEEAVVNIYSKAGMTVRFIDDYMSHHVRGGEVHCATNTFRETNVAWWKSL